MISPCLIGTPPLALHFLLMCGAARKRIVILCSESVDALKKKEDEIEELRWQISQNSLKLGSSQSPGAENKDGALT